MPDCILFRHGKRDIKTGEKSGDGPLTPLGRAEVQVNASKLATTLLGKPGMGIIDLAVVSGSIRCAETFSVLWGVFLENGIVIAEYDMRKEYFSTMEEDIGWASLYAEHGEEFATMRQNLGEMVASMRYAHHLVMPCVNRTVHRIYEAVAGGARTILVCTHGPHDALIANTLTGKQNRGLAQGDACIVSF